MPGLVRKLLIFAAVDGLILQPAPPRNHKPATDQAIKILYKGEKGNAILPLLKDRREEDTAKETLEAHGIVGLLKVASSSFLISISRRDQVALIRGKPVYCVSEVALIPLSSQSDAEQAIVRAKASQLRHSTTNEDFLGDSSDDDENISVPDDASIVSTEHGGEPAQSVAAEVKNKTSTVAEDIIRKKGVYGRFTDRWFSKKGWKAESRRNQGLSSEDDLKKITSPAVDPTLDPGELAEVDGIKGHVQAAIAAKGNKHVVPAEVAHVVKSPTDDPQIALLPKVLTVSKIFFGTKNFYFSYDHDLSRSVATQVTPSSSLPLFRSFDPIFFWNRQLMDPFIQSGQHGFVLPLIQGFVGQREFTVDTSSKSSQAITDVVSDPKEMEGAQDEDAAEEPVDSSAPAARKESTVEPGSKKFFLTLISRRSIDRAGLRYLRRGVDGDGHVANSVETEQILSPPSWDPSEEGSEKLYSFVQYRGSMPLFFSQSPYSLKPIAMLHGSTEANAAAFRLHFQYLKERYGQIQVASLVEKKGNEAKVGDLYQEHANELIKENANNGKEGDLAFEWFDFHSVCKGMRFENVSLLFDKLNPTLTSYGWTVKSGPEHTLQRQSGVLRTNCMDCLDRTNVVQSACGRLALECQLAEQGITIDLQKDPSTAWFNTVWADNGDAISRQYAGTAALKGDFTRTRRRNISGALTDFGLTLTRYYNNIVNDYFAQAVIDFLLGRADENIFIDFEADMQAKDYAIDLRKVRQNAIDTCANICIENADEHLVAAWTLRCPAHSGTLKSLPLEECVLLLTETALYFCRMDWSTEKVRAFEKVELECIEGLARGTYITSTFAKRDIDEKKNVGFTIAYNTKGKDLVRTNTRSLTSVEEEAEDVREGPKDNAKAKDATKADGSKILAFKALPPRSSYVNTRNADEEPPSEAESIQLICDQIAKLVNSSRSAQSGEQSEEATSGLLKVREEDIVSLSEARKNTGYLETLGYSIKKLVWAS